MPIHPLQYIFKIALLAPLDMIRYTHFNNMYFVTTSSAVKTKKNLQITKITQTARKCAFYIQKQETLKIKKVPFSTILSVLVLWSRLIGVGCSRGLYFWCRFGVSDSNCLVNSATLGRLKVWCLLRKTAYSLFSNSTMVLLRNITQQIRKTDVHLWETKSNGACK